VIGTPVVGGSERPSAFLRAHLDEDGLSAAGRATLNHYYRNWRARDSRRIAYWYDHQLRDIDRLIAAGDRPRVLDAGAGTGSESLWFAQNGARVLGIDVDQAALALARERLDLLSARLGVPLECTFDVCPILDVSGTFDIVWLEQAFHHMEPRGEVLDKLASLVVPGGHLVFSEANAWNPLIQAVLYRLRGRRTVIRHQGVLWGHERILTPRRLARLVRSVGFETVSRHYFRVFPAGARYERLFGMERALCRPALQRLAFPIYTHYSLVARRR